MKDAKLCHFDVVAAKKKGVNRKDLFRLRIQTN